MVQRWRYAVATTTAFTDLGKFVRMYNSVSPSRVGWPAQHLEATLRGRQVVAVQDLYTVSGDRRRQFGPQFRDDSGEASRRIAHEGRGEGEFGALELAVDGDEGGADLALGLGVGRVDRGIDLADDQGHQIDQAGEGNLVLVLGGGMFLEEVVEGSSVEGIDNAGMGHDRNRGLLDKALQQGREHGACLLRGQWTNPARAQT